MSKLVFSVLIVAATAWGQPAQSPAAPSDARATPQSSVLAFLQACRQGEYRRAASFLDISSRRGQDGAELARQTKEVLDRSLSIDPARLSNRPEGDLTDGLDPKYELLGTVPVNGRPVDLLLERVARNGAEPLWLFSSATLGAVPVLHEGLENRWIEQRLPDWALARGPLDAAVWQWLALLLLATVVAAFSALLARAAVALARPLARRTRSDLDDSLLASVVPPMRLLMAIIVFRAGLVWVAPPVLLRTYTARLLSALFYIGAAWLTIRIIDVLAAKALVGMTGRQRASASSVVPLLRRTAKVTAFVITILATLSSWGYNTTAILAGLGVGGLAVALAAQKTLENLFGGVSITTDKPVLIGDYCRYGDRFGTVEDIGLRSTRLRTTERTLVTIPNGQFASLEIENFGKRDKIFFHPILRLRLDTTPEQVRSLIQSFRDRLIAHPKIDPTPARVRLITIGTYSLDIEIFSYILTTDFDEFLVIQEELLFGFLDEIKAAGTALAVPAQHNIISRDTVRHNPSVGS
jgi:MscS family membrane protein